MENSVKTIAYYLPQFHPIPENDTWWGKGFTEWTNVTKAKPLFSSHYQPRLPSDLGYYDLRLPEVRLAQAELAKQYGIDGFCYWHYWFKGRRLLERPFNDVLTSGKPEFPFCLAWANESWTRTWEGDEKEFLVKQEYSDVDDLAHARWLAEVFSDSRYIRIEGRPLLMIYRAPMLPNSWKTIEVFRNECVRLGVPEPYIIGRDTHNPGEDMRNFGCDITETSTPRLDLLYKKMTPFKSKFIRNIQQGIFSSVLNVYDYKTACNIAKDNLPSHHLIRSIMVGWDNTARRASKSLILNNVTPEYYYDAFLEILKGLTDKPVNQKIVFINAWNEWAEGMHLEPDIRYGHKFLQATGLALENYNKYLIMHLTLTLALARQARTHTRSKMYIFLLQNYFLLHKIKDLDKKFLYCIFRACSLWLLSDPFNCHVVIIYF